MFFTLQALIFVQAEKEDSFWMYLSRLNDCSFPVNWESGNNMFPMAGPGFALSFLPEAGSITSWEILLCECAENFGEMRRTRTF